ncbi:excinuclease ABC subunit UvrA [Niabella yanshanensis]|uniref:UvrABC system protein A n=1 Tax=Niabella yanshanensis TaxID=577386 RepID=A0ABZ0W733_9BACT|nr:excinuclease ABC subunit UvrA [Niabella yanshanensis]WQD39080.1 excinuclease ABC subunit UvrA [Niabella yanshanensis]
MKYIKIKGARQNNLRNLSLQIPKNQISVFTGVSGSGKSSLVFETIGAEAQRQINETQSSFVRNRLQHLGVADVDHIAHLNVPVIIDQKRLGGNARSTVGTATDIYASLRLLFSRLGQPFAGYSNVFSFNHPQGMCTACEGLGFVSAINTDALIDQTQSLNEGAIRFPTFQPGGYRWLRYTLSGYFDNDKNLQDYTPEEWDLLLHADTHKPPHPSPGWGKTMQYQGLLPRLQRDFLKKDSKELKLRQQELASIVTTQTCPSCRGQRLNETILSCRINKLNIADCAAMPIDELLTFIQGLHAPAYDTVLQELLKKLQNMVTIGLQYLILNRATNSLSGGESQRIKMVRHLGNSLENLLYIFDEPSIGLHPKDLDNLTTIIKGIKAKENTVLIVEHDPDLVKIADHVVDMGPGSGAKGGTIVYQGNFKELAKSNGKTGVYFAAPRSINKKPRQPSGWIQLKNGNLHNLKNISVAIPQQVLTVVTGVAGSGKSTLMSKVLPQQYPQVKIIDQSPMRGSIRSNLLTYLGIADQARQLFARANKVSAALFSSNSEGACPNCRGQGIAKIDLAFMDDIEAPCEVCAGSGFKPEVLMYTYQGKNIVEVLQLTIAQARIFFADIPFISGLDILIELGMDYMTLGERLSDFSGGERQRLKLSRELNEDNSLLVLDEPSTGLHPSDTKKLMGLLNQLVDKGNTLVVIEHNLDIIAQADWVIDIGPGAGKQGGELVFGGPVKELLQHTDSATASYLNKHLKGN